MARRKPKHAEPSAHAIDAATDPPNEAASAGVAEQAAEATPAESIEPADEALEGETPVSEPPVPSEGDGEDPEERELTLVSPPSDAPVAVADTTSNHLKHVIESLVFVSDRPITVASLARHVKAKQSEVQTLLEQLVQDYRGRGIELIEAGGGFQFRSAPITAPFVRDLVAHKPVRLTRAQLETLALVAYRQPVTRPEIDDVRGVDSGSAIKVLLDRGLLKLLGRKDEAGRPLLYGTSPYFLEFFGMSALKDLPTLREFSDLSDESRELFKRKLGGDPEEALLPVESTFSETPLDESDEDPEDTMTTREQGDVAEREDLDETAGVGVAADGADEDDEDDDLDDEDDDLDDEDDDLDDEDEDLDDDEDADDDDDLDDDDDEEDDDDLDDDEDGDDDLDDEDDEDEDDEDEDEDDDED